MNTMQHRNVSLSEQIFEQLEHDILSGKYAKGDVLSELRLSQELGVSRTPIREALIALEREKLLENTSRGMEVVGISRKDMMDMYEIRLLLEGRAAAKAAENAPESVLAEMSDILDLQSFYIGKQENSGKDLSDNIKDLDSAFHELIYSNCGSSAYRDTLVPMHKKMTKFRKASVSRKSRAAESLSEHRAILEALKARDAAGAEQLMVQHVRNARDSIADMEE